MQPSQNFCRLEKNNNNHITLVVRDALIVLTWIAI